MRSHPTCARPLSPHQLQSKEIHALMEIWFHTNAWNGGGGERLPGRVEHTREGGTLHTVSQWTVSGPSHGDVRLRHVPRQLHVIHNNVSHAVMVLHCHRRLHAATGQVVANSWPSPRDRIQQTQGCTQRPHRPWSSSDALHVPRRCRPLPAWQSPVGTRAWHQWPRTRGWRYRTSHGSGSWP